MEESSGGREGSGRGKCTRPSAPTAVPSVRSPSSLPREGRFTAGSAGRSGGSEGKRPGQSTSREFGLSLCSVVVIFRTPSTPSALSPERGTQQPRPPKSGEAARPGGLADHRLSQAATEVVQRHGFGNCLPEAGHHLDWPESPREEHRGETHRGSGRASFRALDCAAERHARTAKTTAPRKCTVHLVRFYVTTNGGQTIPEGTPTPARPTRLQPAGTP